MSKTKIVTSKGTAFYFIDYSPKIGLFYKHPKTDTKIQPTEKLVCDTCKCDLDSEMSRILITRNVDNCPQFFAQHFFAPCWNFDDFCKNHPHLTLDRMGFSIPENTLISDTGLKYLQTESHFWD